MFQSLKSKVLKWFGVKPKEPRCNCWGCREHDAALVFIKETQGLDASARHSLVLRWIEGRIKGGN